MNQPSTIPVVGTFAIEEHAGSTFKVMTIEAVKDTMQQAHTHTSLIELCILMEGSDTMIISKGFKRKGEKAATYTSIQRLPNNRFIVSNGKISHRVSGLEMVVML